MHELRDVFRNSPPWLQYYVFAIAVLGVLVLTYYGYAAWRASVRANALARSLATLGPASDEDRDVGRAQASIDAWRSSANQLDAQVRVLRDQIDRRLVSTRVTQSERRYKLRDDGDHVISEDVFIASIVDLRLLDSAPALLTALGLLGTFIAIALGLGGVSIDATTQRVEGIGALLGGLSGKFVTSIAAIFMSIIVQICDSLWIRPSFSRQHRRILNAVDTALPTLSAGQQFSELLTSSRQQERSLANISSDVVDKFSEIFSTNLIPELGTLLANRMQLELGPALEKVASGIAALEEGIGRLESGKQESLAGEVRQLTATLEQSLRSTLEQMGSQFREALSGSAGQEFEHASSALRASADVLQGMNSSFSAMQGSMARLLEESERRASRTFEENEGRTKSLNELVERLVGQLNETATTSAGEVQRLLVEAVSGLGARFTAFGDEMEARVRHASAASTEASERIVTEAMNAAGRSSSETERVLAKLGERADDFVQAATQLRELREGVQSVLAETGAKVRELHEAGSSFRVIAVEVSSLTKSLRDTQDQQKKSAELSASMVARVETVVDSQSRVLTETRSTFDSARTILDDLDKRLGSVLTVVVQQMQGYNTQVEQNFEKIMLKVNERMPELFDRLEGSLQQVADSVEELQDTVARANVGRNS